MADTWITPEMHAAVGAELGRVVAMPISESDIRKWAQAVYYPEAPPRLFWDSDFAATTPHGGIVAPEDFNPFAWMTAAGPRPSGDRGEGGGGPELTLGIEPPTTSFMLNGGMSCTYSGVRMRPGDVITSVTRLAEYTEREGRLGRMLFTASESEWTNQDGALVKTARMSLIRY
jgi:hypothetical protein